MLERNDAPVDFCPNCGVGRIKSGSKPYLKLFQGQLFTIPDATIWNCDICPYSEFDDSVFETIDHMIDGAVFDTGLYSMNRQFLSPPDDELSQKGKPPSL